MFATYHFHITPNHSDMLGYKETKAQDDTTFTSQVTGCQAHAIGKVIRPIRVTFHLPNCLHIHMRKLTTELKQYLG